MGLIPKFKAIDLFPSGSKITTNFGWDIGPKDVSKIDPNGEIWPRIHHAIDRISTGFMKVPFNYCRGYFIEKDKDFDYSVLRLIIDNCELRILHINKNEIDKETKKKMDNGQLLIKNDYIAPCGNTGMSFDTNGGDGRHAHYSFYIPCDLFDTELDNKFGKYWKEDLSKSMSKQYGKLFDQQISNRGIIWINSFAIKKWDKYWNKNMIIINTEKVFE